MITCHGCLNSFSTMGEFADHACPVYTSEAMLMDGDSPEGVVHVANPKHTAMEQATEIARVAVRQDEIEAVRAMDQAARDPCVLGAINWNEVERIAEECDISIRRGKPVEEPPWLSDGEAYYAAEDAKRSNPRKLKPLATGCLDYFPDALLAVAECSRVATEQHHPGEPVHWDRSKSTDEADALMRHLIDRGKVDTDGVRHSAKVAWRALALLQREIDGEG